MRRSNNKITASLREAGIQPQSLAKYITRSLELNQKYPTKFRSKVESLAHETAVAQAELFLVLITTP